MRRMVFAGLLSILAIAAPERAIAQASLTEGTNVELRLPDGDFDVGERFAVSGNLVALAGDDRVVVFERRGIEWVERARVDFVGVRDVGLAGADVVAVNQLSIQRWTLDGDVLVAGQTLSPWSDQTGRTRLAFDGQRLVVTSQSFRAPGGIWVYRRGGDGTFGLEQQLAPEGLDVALDGDRFAFVPRDAEVGVYDFDGAEWVRTSTLAGTAPSPQPRAAHVALSGDFLGVVRTSETGMRAVFARVEANRWSTVGEVELPAANRFEYGGVGVEGSLAALGDPSASEVRFYRLGEALTELGRASLPDRAAFGREVVLRGGRLTAGYLRRDQVTTGGTVFSGDIGGAHQARLVLADGAACGRDPECGSGFCVDGVCCNEPCGDGRSDDCRACSVAAGGGADGVCEVVAAGAYTCRPEAGPCDQAEVCDGASARCPADEVRPAGEQCAEAVDTCDVADVCDGFGVGCPEVFAANGLVCAETDACGGWCVDGACMAMPGACDDGDVCTEDRCGAGGCEHVEIEGCCRADADCDDGDDCTIDSCQVFSGRCESRGDPMCVQGQEPAPTPGEGSGGCTSLGAQSGLRPLAALVFGLGLWRRRRRQVARPPSSRT